MEYLYYHNLHNHKNACIELIKYLIVCILRAGTLPRKRYPFFWALPKLRGTTLPKMIVTFFLKLAQIACRGGDWGVCPKEMVFFSGMLSI